MLENVYVDHLSAQHDWNRSEPFYYHIKKHFWKWNMSHNFEKNVATNLTDLNNFHSLKAVVSVEF